MSSNNLGGSLTDAQVDASVWLSAWLCQEWSITPDQLHILAHYELDAVNRPYCPGFSASEWTRWTGRVAEMVKSGTPQPEPPVEDRPTLTTTIDASGTPITVIRWGGKAKAILGTNAVDVGVSVTGMDGATYDRSLQQNTFKPWVKRP
jgi:hypothetical protein